MAEKEQLSQIQSPSVQVRINGVQNAGMERDCRLLSWIAKTSKKELYVYVSLVLGFGLFVVVLWDLIVYAFSERTELSTQNVTDAVLVTFYYLLHGPFRRNSNTSSFTAVVPMAWWGQNKLCPIKDFVWFRISRL